MGADEVVDEAQPRRRRWVRVVVFGLLAVVLVAVGLGLWVRSALTSSLPALDGELTVEGLSAPVVITRDAKGVPTLTGENRQDLAFAIGFLHGQERFFQMDLGRRAGAGELAGLFGERALPVDQKRRIHRSRHVAEQAWAQASPRHRALTERYAAGVNAGLKALDGLPFEYRLLGAEPAPWTPVDSYLSILAIFYDMLDETARYDRMRGALFDGLPQPMAEWLTARGTARWDAAMDGTTFPPVPMPGPEVVDMRSMAPWAELKADARAATVLDGYGAASNSWAVAGRLTQHGHAIVANDPHLTLRLPTAWYRNAWQWTENGETRRIEGVSLPGGPVITMGSNGHVAWTLTNSRTDTTDAIPLVLEGDGYRTPDGVEAFVTHTETIEVAGAEPVQFEYRWTRWGPVVDDEHGLPTAIQWVGHRPEAVDVGLIDLEDARDVPAALDVGARSGTPALNLVVGDRTGRIGWSIIGYLPERFGPAPPASEQPVAPTDPAAPDAPADPAEPVDPEAAAAPAPPVAPAEPAPAPPWSGYDGRLPYDASTGERGWKGRLPAARYPRIVDPPGGLIWNGNGRMVGGADYALLGETAYVLGARQQQVRDGLLEKAAKGHVTMDDMLAVQLDDRSIFLEHWRAHLVGLLERGDKDPLRARALHHLQSSWTRRASPDSVGHRLARALRGAIYDHVIGALTLPAAAKHPEFVMVERSTEGALWQLVTTEPEHLLHPNHESWEDWQRAIIDEALVELTAGGGPAALDGLTWARKTEIEHPMAGAIPLVGDHLRAPPDPLPGDTNMPRVQSPNYGASMHFAVAPGKEAEGYLQLPGGQSGHPLSPYFLDQYADWAAGRRQPLQPGATQHTLTLSP